MRRQLALAFALMATGCLHRPTMDPNVIVVAIQSAPNNLDPRFGTDDASGKIDDLMFDSLMGIDEHLHVTPRLADHLDHPDPLTYVATLRQGVHFHDGHELTSADVVYTFKDLIAPDSTLPRRGGYREVATVVARDRYTVVFTLKAPFTSFPVDLVPVQIIADGAGPELRDHFVGTGPYKFVRYAVDDRIELSRFDDYFGGRPKNDGIVLKIVPDDVMRGLELRKGTADLVVNDLTPDIAFELTNGVHLQQVSSPGVDYQYLGVNLLDPALKDVRVRQAIAYAIDRHAIVDYLRRGLAVPAAGMLPAQSWAFAPDAFSYPYDPARAKQLLDEAGFVDPDGDGPRARLHLTLKIANTQEFQVLQAAAIQRNLRDVGIDLDVRNYEFATMYNDVVKGNFQLYSLQWTAGSLADPDILRRVFHSKQTPPAGFNRGHFNDPQVDALLDAASASADVSERRELFQHVQRILAREVPYISLWTKQNFIVGQRSLSGLHVTPLADLLFLRDVSRVAPLAH